MRLPGHLREAQVASSFFSKEGRGTDFLFLSELRNSKRARVKVKELVAMLEADGWFVVRMKGSYRQFHHRSKLGTVAVSGKLATTVPTGTLHNALKQTE